MFPVRVQRVSNSLHRIPPQRQPRRQLPARAPPRMGQRLYNQLRPFPRITRLLPVHRPQELRNPLRQRLEIRDPLLGLNLPPLAEDLGPEVAWLDGGDFDAEASDLLAEGLGEYRAGGFRGGVEARAGCPVPAHDGAEVGDHARAAGAHVGEDGAEDGEHAEDVGGEEGLDLGGAGSLLLLQWDTFLGTQPSRCGERLRLVDYAYLGSSIAPCKP